MWIEMVLSGFVRGVMFLGKARCISLEVLITRRSTALATLLANDLVGVGAWFWCAEGQAG